MIIIRNVNPQCITRTLIVEYSIFKSIVQACFKIKSKWIALLLFKYKKHFETFVSMYF